MTHASIAKRVRFYPGISLSAESGPQLTDEEIPKLWYTRDELAVFKMECRYVVDCRDGMTIDEEEESNKENMPSSTLTKDYINKEQMTEQGIGHGCRHRMRYARTTRKCILSVTKQMAPSEVT